MKRLFVLFVFVGSLSSQGWGAAGFTTEFQARVANDDEILNALDKMGVDSNTCPLVSYRLYDNNDSVFQKNDISVRYRDKGKKSDLCVKIKLQYSEQLLKVLSVYFADETIKKEINRYYNFGKYAGESGQVELTFKAQVKKKDLGLDVSDRLDDGQIMDLFYEVLKKIKNNYPEVESTDPILNSIKYKMSLFMDGDLKLPLVVRSFNRCSWEIKDWNGYETVTAEYSNTQHSDPFLEISTRVEGNNDSNDFFDKLKEAGVFKEEKVQ